MSVRNVCSKEQCRNRRNLANIVENTINVKI